MNLQKLHERVSRSGLDTGFLQLLKCTKGFLFSVLATQELLFSKSLKWLFEMYKKKKMYLKYSKIGDWEKIRDEKTRERAGLGSGTAHTQPRRRG